MVGAAKMDDDEGINEINVTPLVDVMLVLLVIFMVASVYIVKESIAIELPKAATATDTVETTVSIVMDRNRELIDVVRSNGLERFALNVKRPEAKAD